MQNLLPKALAGYFTENASFLNIAEREPILSQLKRFKQKRKIFYGAFQNTRSRTVTSNDCSAPNAEVSE
ncbi:hypothetical protein TNCV_4373501 [Trichonephila clavipes]|uniref:Uncharacterized protein n=1 Tax=Trichonephila clavipes TaxID=2585209 RepID=A0A8X6RCJ2_TRICX|nr:hypothetical protein TNCV_4373501 [Trichonephila clavipes]